MIKLKVEKVSKFKVLIERKSLRELIRKVTKLEKVEVTETQLDLLLVGIMTLAEKNKAFRFLYDKREDVYTISDVKVKYR